MQLSFTAKEFRNLLDMVYIGNWVLNSTRGDDRFKEYDDLESRLFSMVPQLNETWNGEIVPSREYMEGGIHDVISLYEDNVFFDILAEKLAWRDMNYPQVTDENTDEIESRADSYMEEFEEYGLDRLQIQE